MDSQLEFMCCFYFVSSGELRDLSYYINFKTDNFSFYFKLTDVRRGKIKDEILLGRKLMSFT